MSQFTATSWGASSTGWYACWLCRGFKTHSAASRCSQREAAQSLFPLQRIDGWGFDVEVLYIARRHGMRLTEVPINWYYQSDSRVRPIHDTINMVRELLKIRRNGASGYYDAPAPASVADELPAIQ
jgi:dolichyl-phosphate beta-glucosyltransferase